MMMLNIDDPHWLINAIQLFKNNSRVGQIAAIIVNAKNPEMLLDCGIFQYTYKFGGLFHGHQRDQVNDLHKMRRLVLGACSDGTVIRRSVLEEIGGFDARYFYPVEDLDVSFRVHLAGLDVIYDPSFLVYHYESQTMEECISRKMYLCRRNCLLALVDNYPIVFIIKMISKMILQEILLPLSCFAGRVTLGKTQVSNLNKIFDYIRALSFLFTITVSTIKKRRAVNKFRRRSRSYLCNVNNQFLKSLENFALFYRYGDLH